MLHQNGSLFQLVLSLHSSHDSGTAKTHGRGGDKPGNITCCRCLVLTVSGLARNSPDRVPLRRETKEDSLTFWTDNDRLIPRRALFLLYPPFSLITIPRLFLLFVNIVVCFYVSTGFHESGGPRVWFINIPSRPAAGFAIILLTSQRSMIIATRN